MDAVEKYEMDLSRAVLKGFDEFKGLVDMPKVKIYGLTDFNCLRERDPTFAFKVEDKRDEEVVGRLWTDGGIATRAEDFYSKAMESYSQQTMIRISLVHHNTLQEIAVFLETLSEICKS